jgi:sugar transferase EpsL
MKRTVDIIVATACLIAALPLLAVLVLLIRLMLGTPVLFRQTRPGHMGRPFTLYKLRTMSQGHDAAGRLLPDGARLGAFGRFLRSMSLDEIPELFNVIRGDMSLVGPRPLLMEYLGRYSDQQARRHEVKPGMTGWAQVNGRNAISWDKRFALDVWYVDHQSMWLDAKILWLTAYKVLTSDGINAPDHATMPEFMGDTRS